MKAITLTEVIKQNCKDKEFLKHFRRERMINEIAKMMVNMRQKNHLTQKELANKAGTTQPVIARLESGSDKRIPSLELLTKIVSAANANLIIKLEYKTKKNNRN
jgi:transcriptional regulator with XRE-family HTH domain